MTQELKELKMAARKEMVARRKALPAKFAAEASARICARLGGLAQLTSASSICGYHPAAGEPDVLPYLSGVLLSGRKVFLPKHSPGTSSYGMASVADFADGLSRGRFGIMEPVDGERLSRGNSAGLAWLVPGTAFSADGGRIGFGGGAYDSLLSRFGGVRIGVCYQFQMLGSVPVEPHDVKMEYVITEERTYVCDETNKEEN